MAVRVSMSSYPKLKGKPCRWDLFETERRGGNVGQMASSEVMRRGQKRFTRVYRELNIDETFNKKLDGGY